MLGDGGFQPCQLGTAREASQWVGRDRAGGRSSDILKPGLPRSEFHPRNPDEDGEVGESDVHLPLGALSRDVGRRTDYLGTLGLEERVTARFNAGTSRSEGFRRETCSLFLDVYQAPGGLGGGQGRHDLAGNLEPGAGELERRHLVAAGREIDACRPLPTQFDPLGEADGALEGPEAPALVAAAEPAEVLKAAPEFRIGTQACLKGIGLHGLAGGASTSESRRHGESSLNGLLGRSEREVAVGWTDILSKRQSWSNGESCREPNNTERHEGTCDDGAQTGQNPYLRKR
ncbi:Hypothetical protein RMP42_05922 (plasmid) [Roseomonas mucosa]|nr:Hypothetical protein RMP42_05922 [Roseomonas mucosa]